MIEVGDKAFHIRSGHEVEITKVGAVTYGIYDFFTEQSWTVPQEDIRPSPQQKPFESVDRSGMDCLSFSELRAASETRNSENAGGESDWTLADWGNALAGETGELCNFIKKSRRNLPNDPSLEDLKQDMANELADIVTYADLIANKLGVDLGKAVREKFNVVSKRRNSQVTL